MGGDRLVPAPIPGQKPFTYTLERTRVIGSQGSRAGMGDGQGGDHDQPGDDPGGQDNHHGPQQHCRAGTPPHRPHRTSAGLVNHRRGQGPVGHVRQAPVGDSRTRYIGW